MVGEFVARDSSLQVWEVESCASGQTQRSRLARLGASGQSGGKPADTPTRSVEKPEADSLARSFVDNCF
jgi:hypothetical protein